MERIGPTIEGVNRTLIDAGVMPHIERRDTTSEVRTHPFRNAAEPQPEPRSENVPASGGIDFAAIQSLLAGARGDRQTHEPPVHPNGADTPAMTADEVLHLLSQAQYTYGTRQIDPATEPLRVDLNGVIASDAAGKTLARADDDTVNFIGMLFDFILDDRNLALPMQAVLARLQIPLLKVALSDRAFFSNPSHPARALLNELSSAGVGWSSTDDLHRDAVFEQIHAVVTRILQEFSTDTTLFEELLEDFREFIGREHRRSLLVEQRVRETENGKGPKPPGQAARAEPAQRQSQRHAATHSGRPLHQRALESSADHAAHQKRRRQ